MEGKLVFTTDRSVSKGQNIMNMQSFPSWKPGIYLISVQQDKEVQMGKLVYQ
jgi:hypothetical protein